MLEDDNDSRLTVDLDDDEPFRNRLIKMMDRLLGSNFIQTEQAHDDVVRLRDLLLAIEEK